MVKGIIFDYGGTLDSGGDHWSEVIFAGYLHAGLQIEKEMFREAYVYGERELARTPRIRPDHNFLDLMRIKVGIELDYLKKKSIVSDDDCTRCSEIIARFCDVSARNHIELARPVLRALYAHYPIVLVSNFYGNIASVLKAYGIDGFFDSIIESAVAGVRKPDPRIFELGVSALGLKPSETLVIGDSLRKDIEPAESIGCAVAWLKGKGWTPQEDAQTHTCEIKSLRCLLHDPRLSLG